ncbi:MAG: rhodanese-like domain-containing protein [Gemmatimonas sp.]|jgi:phage shock protein E|uniref:rhodanese-like domain-containing protein n=1 Tax=Gemmatimonas sp. TaxID=1962908 RepID=UPI00391FAE83|nr:rhodanese-like domain-containing protein [Gemmatimonadota bacterium]
MPTFRQQPVDVVIDVRSKVEFWLGHLPDAVCVPVDTLPDGLDKVPGVTTDSKILVYCASGARSARAAQILQAQGYRHVTNAGGLSDARAEFTA